LSSTFATWSVVENCKSSDLLLSDTQPLYRAKYPLAIVNKLLDVLGSDIACGYDIACAFWKTLMASCLGKKAQELSF
jgi:hypothetical protein